MSYSIVSQPEVVDTISVASKQPFDISFGTTYNLFDYTIQFTDSTPALLTATSSNKFVSTAGFTGTGNAGTLVVDAISTNPPTVTTLVPRIYGNTSMQAAAVDSNSGAIYFADTNNHTIYVSDSNGNYSLFAGTGTAGYGTGNRLSATFNLPIGLAVGDDGSVYVSDLWTIRKIDTTGNVTILAGSNVSGAADGTGTAARFLYPASLLVSNTDIYVSDADNHAIRKVTQAGVVTTYAGVLGVSGYTDGGITSPTISNVVLMGMTNSSDGTTAFAYSSDGVSWTTLANGPFLGAGETMNGFAVSPTRVVAVGAGSNAIVSATVLSVWGGYGKDMFGSTTNSQGRAVAYGNSIWVAVGEGNSNSITRSTDGQTWSSNIGFPVFETGSNVKYANGTWVAVGLKGTGTSSVGHSTDGSNWTPVTALQMATNSNAVAVATNGTGNWVIAGYANTGTAYVSVTSDFSTWFNISFAGSNFLQLAYAKINNNDVWLLSRINNTFQRGISYSLTSDGSTWSTVSSTVVSNIGNTLYYSSNLGAWIANSTGNNFLTSLNGVSGWTEYTNAVGLPATSVKVGFQDFPLTFYPLFYYPRQITQDSSGSIYVADDFNSRIRTISNDTVSTLASNITRPLTICLDVSRNIYFGKDDQTINKLSNGTTTLVAGRPGVFGSTNGFGSNATFNGVAALALLGCNIYMPEVINGDVRRLNLGVPDVRPSGTRPSGYTIVATSNYNVQVTPRIDVSSTAIGGVIQLYAYEPFTNVFTANVPGDTMRGSGSSVELISFISNPSSSQVTFSSATGFGTAYSSPFTLLIEDLCGSTVMETVSNTVRVGAGRFFPPAQGSVYSFFRNEPITPQPFTATIPIQAPIVSPSLPVGLSFVRTSSNSFNLSGIPTIQTVASNYKVIGKGSTDPTKIVTVDVNIRIGPERLLVDVCGATTIPLTVNSAIQPSVVTSRAPPYPLTGNNIRYTWNGLADGLYFTDALGNIKTTGYTATDPSSTLILAGTPTLAAAASATTKTFTTTVNATRISTPVISSNAVFTFSFDEQVLVQSANVQTTFYVGAPISASATLNSFSALTRFATIDSSISAIWSPDLRSDLSLAFTFSQQRALLTGTPTSTDSGTFMVYASNANGTLGSNGPYTYSIVNDAITFVSPTPSVDTCLNYILGRSALNAKTGYYTAPIEFRATSASGCNVALTTTDLSGTGLTLSNNQITGIPTTVRSLSTLRVDASSLVTTATNSTTVSFAVLPDTFYFTDTSFTFIQNRAITPYRFDVSTNSGRPVIGFTSPDLPSGLSLSAVGRLTGAPLTGIDGSFTVVASTGYTNGSNVFYYDTIPDSMLLYTDPLTYNYSVGSAVDVKVIGLTFSGKTVSNYAFSNFTPSYGLSINSVSGNITGTLTGPLPASCNFSVTASAGLLDGSMIAILSSGTPTFTFDGLTAGTATFTSPTQTSLIFYQYMQITPIVLNATGTGQVYYFIETADLPIGITFDPTTRTISGAPMRLGENTIHVYAKDDTGITRLILYTNTIIPSIVRNQTSAGAYTSLIRQYTEVNAAQNARDRRVLPNETKKLGEFQSPYKLDAVTPDICPKC